MRKILATILLLTIVSGCAATKPTSDFTNTTVDFGIVVSDTEKAAEFYTKGLGLTELPGFDVPADMGGGAGLSDYKPFHVRVMVTADEPNATKVKLMQFPDAPGAKTKNDFIHTSLGVSYLTVWVADIDTAVERARAAGARPLAKGPILLPESLAKGIYLALVRDPDGNMIELAGPKAK